MRKANPEMCDKTEYRKLRDRVETLERTSVKFDEQLKTLFKSSQTLFRVVCVAAFIMLLALIYGALGQRGFNAVTGAAKGYSNATTYQHN